MANEEVTREEIEALRIRLSHAVVTATNDDLSPPLTEKRDRHIARLEAMKDVIDMLAALAASQSRPTKGADITRAREQIVEECARVAEQYNDGVGLATARGIARAIRALSPAPASDNGWLPLVRNWRDARLSVCRSKINTPECAAAITALGAAEDALCKFAATLEV